jgi:hypothetical protein
MMENIGIYMGKGAEAIIESDWNIDVCLGEIEELN